MSEIKQISPESTLELIENKNVKIIDVRTPAEFEAGHIPDSINIPAFLPHPSTGSMTPCFEEFYASIKQVTEKDEELILACKMGGRSQAACDFLSMQGYQDLSNMVGGFTAWKAKGLKST